MATLMIECPKTGRPVRTAIQFATLAREPETRIAVHCRLCGEMHRFSYAEATIEMTPTRPTRVGA